LSIIGRPGAGNHRPEAAQEISVSMLYLDALAWVRAGLDPG